MRATPRHDTPAELALRRELRRLGLRFTVNKPVLAGSRRTADIVFRRAKVALFVDGCFWHGCPLHGSLPKKTNRKWWQEKILGNQKRDRDTNQKLRQAGWRTIRAWEHDDPVKVAKRTLLALARLKRRPRQTD